MTEPFQKRQCVIADCEGESVIMGVKIKELDKILYFCMDHWREMQENSKEFLETHQLKEDAKEGIHFDRLNFWDEFKQWGPVNHD